MKKSEIKLIIVGIASLVISVLLAIATVIVFITNVGMATDLSKLEAGFDSIGETIESMANEFDNIGSEMNSIGEDLDNLDIEIPEIVVET